MILDGQQRITSLFYVFVAPMDINLKNTDHSYKFYLDLNKLSNDEFDDAVWSERSDHCIPYDDIKYQFKKKYNSFCTNT